MRRRVVREIGTIVGIVVILAVVVFLNGYMRRGTLADYMEKVRQAAEAEQSKTGASLLDWELLRQTKGNRRSGPTFAAGLVENRDQVVNLVGFMVPLYDIRQMTEFLLLPLPIQCYFCEMPPMRDVVLVQMEKDSKVDLVNEPVLVNGTLTLNEGAGTKFFYVVRDAQRGPAQQGVKFTRKSHGQEAVTHAMQMKQQQQGSDEEPLIEGHEPPAAPAVPAPAPAPPAPAS